MQAIRTRPSGYHHGDVFDPLDHPGLPVDRHARHWRELDVGPVDPRATDPDTRNRITMMTAVEAAAGRFDRLLAWRSPDLDAGRAVRRLGESASERRRHLTALQHGATVEWPVAPGVAAWSARAEPDPARAMLRQVAVGPTGSVAWRHPGAALASWERLVEHECAACYVYYAFLQQETERQIRPVWELHLQMELAELRAAGELLRRQTLRDPREVVGVGLPEPEVSERRSPPEHERKAGATAAEPTDDGRNLLALLTEQHTRIVGLFGLVARTGGDERRTAFGDLVRLIVGHEVVSGEVVHPLTRRLDPDEHLADRLLDEERRISDALADTVREDAASGRAEVDDALRDLVRAHARHEERAEFPRVLAAVPPTDLNQMGAVVRVAEEAAQPDGIRGEDPAATGPRELPTTAERVRDAVRETSREVRV
jgi:hypothetical protein